MWSCALINPGLTRPWAHSITVAPVKPEVELQSQAVQAILPSAAINRCPFSRIPPGTTRSPRTRMASLPAVKLQVPDAAGAIGAFGHAVDIVPASRVPPSGVPASLASTGGGSMFRSLRQAVVERTTSVMTQKPFTFTNKRYHRITRIGLAFPERAP